MERGRGEGGQAAIEYPARLAVAAMLVVALVALVPAVTGAVPPAVCRILGEADCGPDESNDVMVTPVDPGLSPADRGRLFGPPAGAQLVVAGLTPAELAWLELHDPEAAGAARTAQAWGERRSLVREYMHTDLDDFVAERDAGDHDGRLDWTNDGCSVVRDTGLSFDFHDACTRHDFGYRNYKALGLFDTEKGAVDGRFRADMRAHCATRHWLLKAKCYDTAELYYLGVTVLG